MHSKRDPDPRCRIGRASTALVMALVVFGCAGRGGPPSPMQPRIAAPQRPLPDPIEPPEEYREAIRLGTRTETGAPGPRYWQQWARYDLTARLLPERRRLEGSARIVYYNNSPEPLDSLFLHLYQNLHARGAARLAPQEVTGGVELERIVAAGERLTESASEGPRYAVRQTRLVLWPPRAVASGDSIDLMVDWSFSIPRAGADGRMGWDGDALFFLAYWYPQLAVYDDVVGWQVDRFLGQAEFYAGFGDYDLLIEAPEGWVIRATGELRNPEAVLSSTVRERLRRAETSDEVVHVLTPEDLETGLATRSVPEGRLRWHFQADSVRDVAFSATRSSLWDAVRTRVGDPDRDGRADYARVDALYRTDAPRWRQVARYGRHAIAFLSEWTGLPYPWPHMTAVEGGGIIGGGMEFPMMTLIGDYNERGDSALYYVTAHEFAHMWLPMVVSSDEHRYSWIDEGTTTFNENQARMDFFPGRDHHDPDRRTYLELAGDATEGEILRWSDFHYTPGAFRVASYSKPASVLVALRAVLGPDVFVRAYHAFIRRWAYRHPYPWDLFNTFESVSGRDLSWFWRSWYGETWTLDQAITEVEEGPEGTRVVVRNPGRVPMPVHLSATREDGSTVQRNVPVDVWLAGARRTVVTLAPGSPVVRVEIDPAHVFPDIDRENNVWSP